MATAESPLRRSARTRTALLSFALLAAAFNFSLARRCEAGPWWIELVDERGGEWNSIAVNSDRVPCISYLGEYATVLKYAERDTGTGFWDSLIVDNDYLHGSHTSITLNASGDPRIAYRDGYSDDLWYAYRTGAQWNRNYVDGAGGFDAGAYTSLALASNGEPRISHYDGVFNNLKYSGLYGGTWQSVYVDGADGLNAGAYTSLALDSDNHPYITYYDETGGNLKIAICGSASICSFGSWSLQFVDGPPGVSVGNFTSIQMYLNAPRISYRDETNGDLKYAEWTGSSWNIQPVDTDGRVGGPTSLALDAGGNPHIAYFDFTNYAVKYAVRTGGVWNTEFVDNAGLVGEYLDLALDSYGNAHISYFDSGNRRLLYATNYQVTGVDDAPAAASRLSLISGNPTTGAIRVEYVLPHEGAAVLRVFDIGGREVQRLVDEHKSGGMHRLQADGALRRPGVYFLQLLLDGQPVARRSFVSLH